MVQLITDIYFEQCKNTEQIQEIDFIFKKEIMGAMGNNYQKEIFIDTITGVDGWIETIIKITENYDLIG